MIPVPATWAATAGRFRLPVLGPDGKIWYARWALGFVSAWRGAGAAGEWEHGSAVTFAAASTAPCILMVPTEREAIEILLATFPDTHRLWTT
jgi:hypothetical protein